MYNMGSLAQNHWGQAIQNHEETGPHVRWTNAEITSDILLTSLYT